MKLSERVYKVGSIFLQNGDYDVTVEKLDAKTPERDRSGVTVGTLAQISTSLGPILFFCVHFWVG